MPSQRLFEDHLPEARKSKERQPGGEHAREGFSTETCEQTAPLVRKRGEAVADPLDPGQGICRLRSHGRAARTPT